MAQNEPRAADTSAASRSKATANCASNGRFVIESRPLTTLTVVISPASAARPVRQLSAALRARSSSVFCSSCTSTAISRLAARRPDERTIVGGESAICGSPRRVKHTICSTAFFVLGMDLYARTYDIDVRVAGSRPMPETLKCFHHLLSALGPDVSHALDRH